MTQKSPDSSQTKRRTPRREAPLADRVIAITGAASGIGRALALDCARRGARLALADLNQGDLSTLRSALLERGLAERELSIHELDVRDRAAVEAWAADCARTLGPADAIVNAAGVALHCPLDETTPEDFEWVMATNFWGTVYVTQAFLPQLKGRERSQVVNISSVFGLIAFPASGAYVASKFAVRGFTEALSIEMQLTHPHVRVTSVHPGGIETPLVRQGRVRGSGPLASTPEQVALSFERDLARTSPEACAARIADALSRHQRRVLVGADARWIDRVVRLFPSSYQAIVTWALTRTRARR